MLPAHLLNVVHGLNQSQQISNSPEVVNAILVVLILLTCVFCLRIMFWYVNRIRTDGLQQEKIVNIIKETRKAELYPRIEPLKIEERALTGKKIALEQQLQEKKLNSKEKEKIQASLYQTNQELEDLTKKIKITQKEVDQEAEKYAWDAVPSHLNWSDSFGPYFYIEFGTVIIIVFALLILAITGKVTGQEAVPILAAIVGYVLGKATNKPTANTEKSA